MGKYFSKIVRRRKKILNILNRRPFRQWGLATRLEHRRIKGNQKRKQKMGVS